MKLSRLSSLKTRNNAKLRRDFHSYEKLAKMRIDPDAAQKMKMMGLFSICLVPISALEQEAHGTPKDFKC